MQYKMLNPLIRVEAAYSRIKNQFFNNFEFFKTIEGRTFQQI